MTDVSFKVDQEVAPQIDQNPGADDKPDVTSIISKRLDDSQKHINNMHAKLDKQNEVIQKQNELIEQLLAGAHNLVKPKADGGGNEPAGDQKPQLTQEDVEKKINEALQKRLAEEKAAQVKSVQEKNFLDVSVELTRRYGDSVDEQVAQIAAENGMTYEAAVALAHSHPKAFLRLFPEPEEPQVKTRSSFNGVPVKNQPTSKPADPRNINSLMDRYKELEKQLANRG